MYFADQIVDQTGLPKYEALLDKLSALVKDAVCLLGKTWRNAELAAYPERKFHHATVQVLTRHVCEALDGVSVLAANGCAEPCKPLLRSSFEAMLGIQYILETDEERRGLAYQVAHAHRKIALYKRLDPNENAGKALAAALASDPLAIGVTQNLPAHIDLQKMIANLEGMFRKPEYAAVEAEWAKESKKKDAHWYSLFCGPKALRDLAIRMKHGGMYEFLYRHWSNNVHAGDCFETLAPGANGGVSIRPIRHPEGLQLMVSLAVSITLAVGRTLLDRYATQEQRASFQAEYAATIQQRFQSLGQGELINVPWR
jgi:hypothetical protein